MKLSVLITIITATSMVRGATLMQTHADRGAEQQLERSQKEMVFNVTLAVFSGRPDPQWRISSVTNAALFSQIQSAIDKRQQLESSQMPAILGYKGFLVQTGGTVEYLFFGEKSVDVQTSLLLSMPPNTLSTKFTGNLAKAITDANFTPQPKKTKRRAFPYNAETIEDWNVEIEENNCYNYATNIRTDTFAQPGRFNEQTLNLPLTSDDVREAAIADGLVQYNHDIQLPPLIPDPPTTHLVALVVATGPYGDFHWYRLDQNNKWSHKPGRTAITDRDDFGNTIDDPRLVVNHNLAPDYHFVAFMLVDSNVVRII